MSLHAAVTVEREAFTLDVTLDVSDGEILAVTGPNGAGKTTLLRALAGLEVLTYGKIRLAGRTVEDVQHGRRVPAQHRKTAFVFQDYRLFPHMSARNNIAYGARSHGARRRDARQVADTWLSEIGLREAAALKPRQLSGGQAQRVALARALATTPDLILLDEPLAALDAAVRAQLRPALAEQLRRSGAPSVIVTHDAMEAVLLADRIMVLETGAVVQIGAPAEVARRPATEFVATLMGLNLAAGIRCGAHEVRLASGWTLVVGRSLATAGDDVLVAIRPTAVNVHTERPSHGSPRNVWPAVISSAEPVVDRVRLTVQAPAYLGTTFVDITVAAAAELGVRPGDEVWLSVKATELEAYPASGPSDSPTSTVRHPEHTPGQM